MAASAHYPSDRSDMHTRLRTTTSAILLAAALLFGQTGCATQGPENPPAAATTTTVATVALPSLDNFRDVAGSGGGFPTEDGRHLRTGVVYRSNAVIPDDADLATLAGLHPSTIYDLRTPDESEKTPDRVPAGTTYRQISVIGDGAQFNADMAALTSAEEARELMRRLYRGFVTGDTERRAYADLLTGLAAESGPVVIHCTAGKDRTGFAGYLLHRIAGVPIDVTMTDFLESNTRSAQSIARTQEELRHTRGAAAADIMTPLLTVERSYLEAAVTEIETSYGSVEGYLRTGLGLQDDTLETLRARLVR
ncbi:tyrosine-protein phosphatase [Nocardia farcinica]|uniref:tyrosine-protein phosphatase n=2 Tax=Nocardia farcinica TaxID=37329 RepID=UPI0018958046|nr:tyrosine-protein phosphatase [Nocardia farcinica]MBF6262413.1 tyrosine-protein phosphatase [Nocardia farcinica]MBF6304590.1 tyrosine-protein phosphatase [Nocardia farcinica]MBF6492031.1 tyrosine-protein phosphatase [Nocardia farcinica]MBF6526163.1 tyrosine-protein phosphatase [Nocardia farcinica]MBF6562007.1 tyrosine-protein phosphatase [Nocardia farcinica]